MDALNWVDQTYIEKHKSQDPSELRDMYYPNLRMYSTRDGSTHSKSTAEAISMFLMKFAKKGGISLAVFALSYVPYVGRLVLPAASFYTFNKAVGLGPAALIFGTGIFLPRRYIIIFLQSYFASRSLMRELVSTLSKLISNPTNPFVLARALFLPHQVYQGAEEVMVPRSRGYPIWIRSRILHLSANSPSWRTDLWNRRGIDSIPHHKDHRSASSACS